MNLYSLKDVQQPKRTRMGKRPSQALSRLLCRGSIWGSIPHPFYIVEREETTKSGCRPHWSHTPWGPGRLCQELQLLPRLSGTRKDQHLGARCTRTRTCATADPSVAQDKGLAFDRSCPPCSGRNGRGPRCAAGAPERTRPEGPRATPRRRTRKPRPNP